MRVYEDVLERWGKGLEPDEKDVRFLSDMSKTQYQEIKKLLLNMKDAHIIRVFQIMSDLSESDFTLGFDDPAKFGLDHDLSEVRAAAIHVLRFTDDKKVAQQIMEMAENDPDEDVSAAAVKVLGSYVFRHDMDETIPVSGKKLDAVMDRLASDPRKKVRLATMCGLAYTDSPFSRELVRKAFRSGDPEEIRSALIAAAHSMSLDYAEDVMKYLCSENKAIRMEAIYAAGQIQMRQALPELYANLKDFETEDRDILFETVRSIASIGDDHSAEVLQALDDAVADSDADFSGFIEDCLEDLEMTCRINGSSFFDFDGDFEEEEEDADFEDFEDFEDDEEDDDSIDPFERKEELPEGFEERLAEAQDDVVAFLDKKVPVQTDDDDDDDECECGEHHHHEDQPDISRMHIIDDLESYEKLEDLNKDEDD